MQQQLRSKASPPAARPEATPELASWRSNMAANEALLAAGPTPEGPSLLDHEGGVPTRGARFVSGEKAYADIATGVVGSDYIGGNLGHSEIPRNKNGFVQQYSGLGLPITEEAWGRQNAIDDGKLRTCYAASLKATLQEKNPDLLRDVPKEILEMVEEDPEAREQFLKIVKSSPAFEAWLRDLENPFSGDGGKVSQQIQEGTLDRYIEQASLDDGAEFILELMPTETDARSNPNGIGTLSAALGSSSEWNDFRVGPNVGGFRAGAAGLADKLDDRTAEERARKEPNNVYALPIPYGNTPEHAVGMPGRRGHPDAAMPTIESYVNKIDAADTWSEETHRPTITLSGYSQGGRAALDYTGSNRNKGAGHVDRTLAVAPMGGTTPESKCEEGVWGGEINGTRTLAIEHRDDPARWVSENNPHGTGIGPCLSGAQNFDKDEASGTKRGYNVLHGTPFLDGPAVQPLGKQIPTLTGKPVFEKGTYGYPTEDVMERVGGLLDGCEDYSGDYTRLDGWTKDQLPPGYKKSIDDARRYNNSW